MATGAPQRWARVAAAVLGSAVVLATVPGVAAGTPPVPPTQAVPAGGRVPVPGAGGYAGQRPITLSAGAPSAQSPLRVTLLGDSVLQGSATGVAAALEATGVVQVQDHTFPGFGLSTDTGWRTDIPQVVAASDPQLIVATWGWDAGNVAGTPGIAVTDPDYASELAQAVALMLDPGDGVHPDGVIFLQYPPTGPVLAATPAQAEAEEAVRSEGARAWQRIVETMPARFPGRVMYLPVASSVLLDGRYATWLPPADDPRAPSADWARVRKVDGVHFCQAGVARYADALLADMTGLFHLPPAVGDWSQGPWTLGAVFDTPPGVCPADHPPPRAPR